LYVLIAVVVVLLSVGVWLLANAGSTPGGTAAGAGEEPTPAFTGGPRLVFDETSVDFGTVPLNMAVEHTFVYRNVGDAPLVLQGEPQIETVEGC
jgi:hypothetical protein